MATMTTTLPGLSPADLDSIRESLAAGRKPKVMFTQAAGQIAGQVGQVVELTDPEQAEEWVVVRFGRDELPFSPADLAIPPRRRPGRPAAAPPSAPPPAAGADAPSVPAPATSQETPMSTPTNPSPSPSTAAAASPPASGGERPAKARATKRAAKPKPQPGLTVTLAYTDGEWTVAAQQGSRTLAKPYLIKPTEALKMVALLDVPGVQEAVEQILNAERAQAEQQAERLRAELAEVEARLAELRAAD